MARLRHALRQPDSLGRRHLTGTRHNHERRTVSPTPRPTDLLRQHSEAEFQRALDHRFFAEATDGTLDHHVFRRYLEVEYGFVDTAARCVGRAVHIAPTAHQRRHLASALHDLVHDQVDYFRAVAATVDAQLSTEPPDDSSGAAELHRHALQVAEAGEYLPLLASSLAAEWLYLTWCRRATELQADRSLELDNWILLHVEDAFAGHVEWLRQQLDEGLADSPADSHAFQACLNAFRGTLTAEITFHDTAYEPTRRRDCG
jgi:thiaminase (transcriptional activator TenA)